MAWHARLLPAPALSTNSGVSSDYKSRAFVVVVLLLACLALLQSAPVGGDFWWADAPRHALNGVFIRDFVAAHPTHDPVGWAINYYLQWPALTIMFYPPLFYAVEAIAFTVFGVSHFVAQCTVTLFVLLLAGSAYMLSRCFLPRWSALGAALLVIGTPETASTIDFAFHCGLGPKRDRVFPTEYEAVLSCAILG